MAVLNGRRRILYQGKEIMRSDRWPSKEVAIVIPIYKDAISEDERISLRHLEHYLGGYERYFIAPRGLEIGDSHTAIIYFHPSYFRSAKSYSRLMLSEKFYRSFRDYRYILIYQLDCLVFSDRLEEWCAKEYDYIGAPWLRTPDLDWSYQGPERAGCGGFSLRNVSRCIEAIRRSNHAGFFDLARILLRIRPGHSWPAIKRSVMENPHAAATYVHNEDYWWSFHAKHYLPDFRVPEPNEALEFAFEVDPKVSYEKNNRRLPFGCHAWPRYDRAFWEPYLLG